MLRRVHKHKGSDLASLTSTGRLAALFNPRQKRWSAHFRIDGGEVVPLTDAGEVTARLLNINNPARVEIRETLAQLNRIHADKRVSYKPSVCRSAASTSPIGNEPITR